MDYGRSFRAGPYSKMPVPEPGEMFTCTSLGQWDTPEAEECQGLRVARNVDPLRWQSVADQLFNEISETVEGTIQRRVINLRAPEEVLQERFQAAALEVSSGLPTTLAKLVRADAQAIAEAMHKMLPDGLQMDMKLELFAESVCSRWHQDNYVSRCIVSYNCSATEYTAASNVDFQELRHCGNNDHIIRDKSQIHSANVGDIVMIKGLRFPGQVKGLVHKSPEVSYYDTGDVQARIVLKVDILDLAGGGKSRAEDGYSKFSRI